MSTDILLFVIFCHFHVLAQKCDDEALRKEISETGFVSLVILDYYFFAAS